MVNIKSMFVSRFTDGYIIEADWSQIEVVVAAYLSGDRTLMHEVKNGVDIHRSNASWLFQIDEDEVTSEQRSITKSLTFKLFYGGGAKSMSMQFGIDLDLCQDFIKKFYDKYITLQLWHEDLTNEVIRNSTVTEQGPPKGYILNPNGRKYMFQQKPPPQWLQDKGVDYAYSPTEIKNYPIQGFAGDLLKLYLGGIFKYVLDKREKVLLINTVHDSILFDCTKNYKDEFVEWLTSYLTDTSLIEQKWAIKFDLVLRAEIKAAPTWGG